MNARILRVSGLQNMKVQNQFSATQVCGREKATVVCGVHRYVPTCGLNNLPPIEAETQTAAADVRQVAATVRAVANSSVLPGLSSCSFVR